MNRRTIIISLILIVVLLAGVTESSARSKYFHSLITVYGDGSCGTCHVSASGGGPRNSYGTLFENQANHATDPAAALTAIGPPPTASPTFNPTATSTTEQAASLTETPVQTASSPIATETPTITEAPVIGTTTVTPAAAGFGIGVSMVGLFVSALLVRRNNK
ncbi:MAG: PGF-CTERM sorting domain-containing protein [Candidatus Methanoperedens sp.]|nr:PGF-CTERM sorting domain-containing protein [Candidatus Methanoperedens sp.]